MTEDHDMLLGELKQFRKTVEEDLREIKSELKGLQSFKMKIMGGVAVVVVVFEALKHKFIGG